MTDKRTLFGSGTVYLPDSGQVVRVPCVRAWVLDYVAQLHGVTANYVDRSIASVPYGPYTDYVYGGLLVRTRFDNPGRSHAPRAGGPAARAARQ